jgi:hypothetical protein
MRQDAMGPMAGCAIGDGQIAGAAFETMITVNPRLQSSGGYTVFFIEPGRFMAGGTGSLSYSGRTNWRSRIVGGKNAMFAVTIRTNRRIGLALRRKLAVDPIPIIMLDTFMATAASFRNIEMIY